MICYLPLAGGHIKLAERFVDPAFSFALGWNVWYSSTVMFAPSKNFHVLNFIPAKRLHSQVRCSTSLATAPAHCHDGPAEISAAATIINFWHPGVNNAVWVTMCLVVAIGINMSGVGKYFFYFFFFVELSFYLQVCMVNPSLFLRTSRFPLTPCISLTRCTHQFYQGYYHCWPPDPRHHSRPWWRS